MRRDLPVGVRILLRALPGAHREHLVGDLVEEYHRTVLPSRGQGPARRWLWRTSLKAVVVDRMIRGWDRLRGEAPGSRKRSTPPSKKNTMETVIQDLRYAIRSLARSPLLVVVAVVTLGLGIGANTAIFSVVDGIMLKPLPFHEPERLVLSWETYRTRNMMEGQVSYPNLEEWQQRNRVYEDIGVYHPMQHTLTGMGLPERIRGARSTHNLFSVLGIQPAMGRLFLPEDDLMGAEDVVVVSHSFWLTHFGDQEFTGEHRIVLDEIPFTVVGVLPPDFAFPIYVSEAQLWTPLAQDFFAFSHREYPMSIPVARMKDGVSIEEVRADMARVGREMEEAFPETNTEHGTNPVPLMDQTSARVRSQLYLLLGSVGLVLLIACVNVANLLYARGSDRKREIGIRAALGAGRRRVIQQVLTESLILSVLGGVAGALIALWGTRSLVALLPPSYPRVDDILVDGRVLAFAAGISILTAVVAGILPALRVSRSDLRSALGEGNRASPSRERHRVRRVLVVTEVAMALVLLVGGGLLVRSFQRMMAVDPGFNPENVLTFRMARDWPDYHADRRAEFHVELSERLAALPGAVSAGAGTWMPLTGGFRASIAKQEEPDVPRGERPVVRYLSVTPTYFETLEIPLLRGRSLSHQDTRYTLGVVVVNEAAAELIWPGEDPLGHVIEPGVDINDVDPDLFEVVGVVGNVADERLDADPGAAIYVPHGQQTWPTVAFAVRTAVDPSSLVPQVRELVAEMTEEATFSYMPLEDTLDRSVVERRFLTTVIGLFAFLALVLASVGIYGVLAYSVAQRTHEMGLRMALGAQATRVLSLVLKESLLLVAIGVAIGLLGALAGTRLLTSQLFGVTATDPVTYLGMSLLLIAAGIVATLVPSRRAVRVDPMVALRAE
ncbi:ABC transporter permease [Gemmatimonadota bacterium]